MRLALVVSLRSLREGNQTTAEISVRAGLSTRLMISIYARAIWRGSELNALLIKLKDEFLCDAITIFAKNTIYGEAN